MLLKFMCQFSSFPLTAFQVSTEKRGQTRTSERDMMTRTSLKKALMQGLETRPDYLLWLFQRLIEHSQNLLLEKN